MVRISLKTSILALLVFLSSCTSVSKLVCMPWKVTDVNFNQQSGSLSVEQLRSISYQLKNEFQFRFYPDSVYQVIKGYDTTTGQWQLSADRKMIMTNVNGEEQTSAILKINKREFRFRPTQDLGTINYIRCEPSTTTK